MPHIILEYSSNLGDAAGLSHLLDRLHDALGDTESFESDRIKSRAVRCDTYRVGADRRGFVHATVVFSPGRPEALRRQVGRRLLDIMRSDAALGGADVATSVEIRQFEPGMYITERDR
jgi:5-carboxymethyl-2-hydroxymuconate isomerase